MIPNSARRVGVAAAFVAAALGACDGGTIFGPMVEGDVAEQRAIWTARAIEDYDLSITYFNMWVSPMRSLVSVRDGEVTACWDPVTGNPRNAADEWICPSMDDLFDDVEEKLAATEPWTMTLRYDAKLGLIRQLSADQPGWVDEEYGYSVSNFQRR